MRYQILTLFPELFDGFQTNGLMRRALETNTIRLDTIQLRDFAINSQGQVDDTPYGGGSGMVLRIETARAAIEKARAADPQAKVVLLTPRGKRFSQQTAQAFVKHYQETGGGLVLLCCRYEGIDERVVDSFVDDELSLGDFVLMGGEIPAMAVIEATCRLLPTVLGNPESITEESFEAGLLEYPQYTKPAVFEGSEVPGVLMSGNHEEIRKYRRARAVADTITRRPDLINSSLPISCELSVALIHFPVVDKQGDIITSSITNIDLHDLARSARTYGLKRCYIVHPTKVMRRLSEKICEHWSVGYGSTYNPNRSEALTTLSIVPSFDDVLIDIETRAGRLPKIISTSARTREGIKTFAELSAILRTSTEPHLLLLGTGWGLADEMLARSDYNLEPICGPTPYNHLSVRSAFAIMCDRLIGPAMANAV